MHKTIFSKYGAASDFEILEYNTYATVVVYPVVCYNEFDKLGDETAKKFFELILAKAQVIYANKEKGRNLMDNKVSFKIRHTTSNQVFYVGYKDGYYRIGLAINNLGCRTYSFEKREWIS